MAEPTAARASYALQTLGTGYARYREPARAVQAGHAKATASGLPIKAVSSPTIASTRVSGNCALVAITRH
jgi:hypothetical protein